jgi:hypothetical protein
MQNLVLIGAAFGVVAAFILGWLRGYSKASRAHGWYLPKTDWDNDAAKVQKRQQANYE